MNTVTTYVVIYDLTISKVFVYDPLLWFHCICQALCWFSRIIRMTPMQEMENFFPRYTWVKIPTKPTEIFVTIEFEVSISHLGFDIGSGLGEELVLI